MVANLLIALVQSISDAQPAVHLVMKEILLSALACLSLLVLIVLWEKF